MNDLTVVYYTANHIKQRFWKYTQDTLKAAIGELPLISVSQQPIDFGQNILVGDIGRHHLNIYKQALVGARYATTKYIALTEDDILYSAEHFTKRPSSNEVFAYNMSVWSIYTWVKPPLFSYKDRRVLHSLICNRELFIEAMEERFAKYPDGKVNLGLWSEPGKYERQLGVTERQTEQFFTSIANIAFSHEQALAFDNLGTRKRLGNLRVTGLPQWGSAEEMLALYE